MTEQQTSIIDKIKKLFAMGNRATNHDGSSNEAEASAAMAKAQELLAKYNLDLKMVQDQVKTVGQEEVVGKREKTQINKSAMYKWQKEFWAGLAEANFCWHWIVEVREDIKNSWKVRKVKRHVILGSEANVIAVQMMGEYLCETIERLLPYPNVERLSKAAISWREGCAERLIERIKENAERMKNEGVKSEGSSSTALAVRDMVQAEYAANFDAAIGKGSHARMLKREADWEAGRAKREAERAAQALTVKAETPAEMRKRQEREKKEQAKWHRRWAREQEREAERLDYRAYSAGRTKGNTVSLDDQLKK